MGRRQFPYVKRAQCLLAASVFVAIGSAEAAADNCARSREYLLGGLAGELSQAPDSYKQLFTICIAAAALSNVKDAFVLRDGGIGAIAKRDSVSATAATLSEFCQRFPRATLRFMNRAEQARGTSIGQLVQLSSGGATSCRKIMGLSDR
ncbi:hypothetical protein X566_03070 [Afipia sp. P52-10]|uniref:hypothetical protein n=1 Tax=Afipia sp. P52-10 TaxID=1429916 RepID=UPI0003DF0E94|nr:hypothetical protein [Afipia sp. P52-10]ETR76727.1 hypothetical protein X566_03070 [Afipia sp. P52-10]